MVKRKYHNVRNVPRIANLDKIVMKNPVDELDMDYFHVNGIIFLHTKTKKNKNVDFIQVS